METDENKNDVSEGANAHLFDMDNRKNVPEGFIIPGETKDGGNGNATNSGQPYGGPDGGGAFYSGQPAYQPMYGNNAGFRPCEEAEPEAKGASLLKVLGILFIVFGAFSVLSTLFTTTALRGLNSLFDSEEYKEALEKMRLTEKLTEAMGIINVVSVIEAVIQIIVGILGVKFCKDVDKANLCIVSGAVFAAVVLAVRIATLAAMADIPYSKVSIVTWPIALILPGLFMLGAFKNKKSIRKKQ